MTEIGIEGEAGAPESIAAFAEALLGLERRFEAERPDSVRPLDASDAALAAAIVAAKLLIPLRPTVAATDPASDNGRLIAQLAGTYTEAE